MAPPTWLALAEATGDDKYSVFMDEEFWLTHDYLFRTVPESAPGGGLFLRDSRFFAPDEETGKLIFWGRGNGWVYAGLTSILELLPENHPSRPRYEELFIQMSIAVRAAQVTEGRDAGFWPPSLFAYEEHPYPESSGTGFFVSGILFGVRTGRLNATEYLPAAERGWEALLSAQLADGRIGWTQQIGAGPDAVQRGDTQLYSTGAFLKAAAELLKLACASGDPPPSPQPRPTPTTVPPRAQMMTAPPPPEVPPPRPCGSASPCPPAPVAAPAASTLPTPPPVPPTSEDCSADGSPCVAVGAAAPPPSATSSPPPEAAAASVAATEDIDEDVSEETDDDDGVRLTAEDTDAAEGEEAGAAEDGGDGEIRAESSGAWGASRVEVAWVVAAFAAVVAIVAIAAGAGGYSTL